jgi:hypothetical protein
LVAQRTLDDRTIELTFPANPDGKYLLQGGTPAVRNAFGLPDKWQSRLGEGVIDEGAMALHRISVGLRSSVKSPLLRSLLLGVALATASLIIGPRPSTRKSAGDAADFGALKCQIVHQSLGIYNKTDDRTRDLIGVD